MAEDTVTPEAGTVDEAALAIQSLLNGPQPAAEPDQEEHQPTPDNAEPDAPAPAADQGDGDTQNPSEEAAEADAPAAVPEGTQTPQAQPQAPQPVPPVLQAQQQAPSDLSTVQNQLAQLNQIVPVLQAEIASQFPEVKTADDLVKLASEDPARAVAYQAKLAQINQAVGIKQQVEASYHTAWTAAESQKLNSLIPDLANPAKAPELQQKLVAYARDCGFTDQQIKWAAASDVHLLYQAMQYRDGQVATAAAEKAKADALAQAKAKAAKAPPVQQPGAHRQPSTKDDKAREAFGRLQKSGSPEDAAAVFRNLL